MLNKDIFKREIERLIMFYPTWNIKCDDSKVMMAWYEMFKDFSDIQFINTVKNHIMLEKYNPTAATLFLHKADEVETRPKVEIVRE